MAKLFSSSDHLIQPSQVCCFCLPGLGSDEARCPGVGRCNPGNCQVRDPPGGGEPEEGASHEHRQRTFQPGRLLPVRRLQHGKVGAPADL